MSRVVFMCGPSGAGKSTYAARLVSQGMIRLSMDEEVWRLGLTMPFPMAVHDELEQGLRGRLIELVVNDEDVVLDFGFWSRKMREEYRSLLAPYGVIPETIYLSTSRDVILNRLRARMGAHADDAVLSEATAHEHLERFEPPSPEEGPLTIVE